MTIETPESCDTTFNIDPVFDTVFSSSYLMAYPGSWWNYTGGETVTCLDWKEVSLYSKQEQDGCVSISAESKVLPRFEDFQGDYFISGDSHVRINNENYTHLSQRLIGTTVGDLFYSRSWTTDDGTDSSSHTLQRTYSNHFDSIYFNDIWYYDVMQVHQVAEVYFPHIFTSMINEVDYFYSNNIGLVRYINQLHGNLPDTIDLVDYYIEPYL